MTRELLLIGLSIFAFILTWCLVMEVGSNHAEPSGMPSCP